MATKRIKESYGPPVIPKDATPQQRQAIIQEHRKHVDFVKQLNELRAAQDDEISSLQTAVSFGRVIGMARVRTNGGGALITNFSVGITITLTGAGRLRVTFPSPRPTTNGLTHYEARYTGIGTGLRVNSITNLNTNFFDLVVQINTGAERNMAINAEEGIITVIDYD